MLIKYCDKCQCPQEHDYNDNSLGGLYICCVCGSKTI